MGRSDLSMTGGGRFAAAVCQTSAADALRWSANDLAGSHRIIRSKRPDLARPIVRVCGCLCILCRCGGRFRFVGLDFSDLTQFRFRLEFLFQIHSFFLSFCVALERRFVIRTRSLPKVVWFFRLVSVPVSSSISFHVLRLSAVSRIMTHHQNWILSKNRFHFLLLFHQAARPARLHGVVLDLKKTDYLSNSDDFSLFFLWDFVTSKNLSVRRQWVKTSCSFDGTAAAIDYWSPDLNSPDILGLQQLKLMSKGGGERNRERGGGGGRGVGVWIEKELRRGRNEYNGGGCVGRREIPASIRRTRRHYPRIGPSRNERGREPVE